MYGMLQGSDPATECHYWYHSQKLQQWVCPKVNDIMYNADFFQAT